MRINYIHNGNKVKLHGVTLGECISQIPNLEQRSFAFDEQAKRQNMSGESFVRMMRDKFGWTDLDTKECACSCDMAV